MEGLTGLAERLGRSPFTLAQSRRPDLTAPVVAARGEIIAVSATN
jgi:hypothetical protein